MSNYLVTTHVYWLQCIYNINHQVNFLVWSIAHEAYNTLILYNICVLLYTADPLNLGNRLVQRLHGLRRALLLVLPYIGVYSPRSLRSLRTGAYTSKFFTIPYRNIYNVHVELLFVPFPIARSGLGVLRCIMNCILLHTRARTPTPPLRCRQIIPLRTHTHTLVYYIYYTVPCV